MKVSVLGSGAFGTALAYQLASKGYPTTLWARRQEMADAINEARQNERYMPGIELPQALTATARLDEAVDGAELVVFVIPSHATRAVVKEVKSHLPADAPW